MKRVKTIVGIVLLAAAFLAGYWPQRRQVAGLETEVSTLRDRVVALQAENRAAALLGELLNLEDAVARRDFGQAQQLSSEFFNHVRQETGSSVRSLSAGMSSVLTTRDDITSALARGDESVAESLQQNEFVLRESLAYPVGPPPGH